MSSNGDQSFKNMKKFHGRALNNFDTFKNDSKIALGASKKMSKNRAAAIDGNIK